jgi:Fe-S-cluster containining protein
MSEETPKRQCGSCTACCEALHITEPGIEKLAGEPCRHLCASGCAIYAGRPEVCRAFTCEWLRGTGLKGDRPDKAGVILSLVKRQTEQGPAEFLVANEVRAGALEDKATRKALERAAMEHRINVIGLPLTAGPGARTERIKAVRKIGRGVYVATVEQEPAES